MATDRLLRPDIHVATPDNYSTVNTFLNGCVPAGTSYRWLKDQLARAACIDDEIARIVVVEPSFFGNDFVAMLRVHPHRRKCGVGSELLKYVARQRSTAKLFTSTNLSNQPMQCLLRKHQ
jgi:GNAT superfamily N-acetyltransferase